MRMTLSTPPPTLFSFPFPPTVWHTPSHRMVFDCSDGVPLVDWKPGGDTPLVGDAAQNVGSAPRKVGPPLPLPCVRDVSNSFKELNSYNKCT